MFNVLDMGASGLTAQRARMNTIAGNVLNISTTENARGEKIPYRRRFVTLQPGDPNDPRKAGVRVASIEEDKSPFREVFEPGHKDADPATGFVKYPNVSLETEFVNMLDASRAYEANITMMETTKSMISASLRLLA
jgi:flagellar basal-body rod protein FlgC